MSPTRRAVLLAPALLLATSARASAYRVEGDIVIRERIALPTTSVLAVDVVEASAEGPRVVGSVAGPIGRQSPIPFAVPLERPLRAARRYSVSARISIEGRLWYVNAGQVMIEPESRDRLSVRLVRVGSR